MKNAKLKMAGSDARQSEFVFSFLIFNF